MKFSRLVESIALAMASALHVALCRALCGRSSPGTAGTDAAGRGPILVIRCEAKLGDNLLNVPFLRELRNLYPGRQIHLLHHAHARAIYKDCPYVDRRLEIDWPMSSPRTLWRRLTLCRRVFGPPHGGSAYSIAIIPRWDEDLYAAFLAWFSQATLRVGFSRRSSTRARAWRSFGTDSLLTATLVDRSVQHESHRSLQLLEFLRPDATVRRRDLEFWFSAHDSEKARALLDSAASETSDVLIAIAPGAALDRRKWPLANFVELAKRFRHANIRLVALGSADEFADCQALVDSSLPQTALNLAGRLSLSECASLLSRCRLFIGNDSGLLHLASATGIAIVEISCHPVGAPDNHANSPARFGPIGTRCLVLRPAQPAAPICFDGCAFDSAHCIASIPVSAVSEAANSLLADTNAESDLTRGVQDAPVLHDFLR